MNLSEQKYYLYEIKNKVKQSENLDNETKKKWLGAIEQSIGFIHQAEQRNITRQQFIMCLKLGKVQLERARNEVYGNLELYNFLLKKNNYGTH